MNNVQKFCLTIVLGCLFGGILACSPQAERDGMRYSGESSKAVDRDLAELKKMFTPSAGQMAADSAAVNWPECKVRSDKSSQICADWRDRELDFRLIAVKNNKEEFVPVVESNFVDREKEKKIAIHLTGGTDLPVYSFYSDPRTTYLSFFQKNGYKIASVAYWGTNFRTNLIDNEILLAADDFGNVYDHYARSCNCKPFVIAESLGAAVLFNYLKKNDTKKIDFIAISPVMNGINDAIIYYKEQKTNGLSSMSAKTSNFYALGSDNKFHRVNRKLINSLDHLSSFIGTESTKFDFQMGMPKCFKFLIGANDPLNAKFDGWERDGVVKISNVGHDLTRTTSSQLQSVFEDFMKCLQR